MSTNKDFRSTNSSNNPNQIPSLGTKPVKRSGFNDQVKGGGSIPKGPPSGQSGHEKR